MFGGGGGGAFPPFFLSWVVSFRKGRGRARKGKDSVHPLHVTLADLYNGKTKKMKVTHRVICSACKGSGAKGTASAAKCRGCEGRGVKVQIQRMGPMITQRQMGSPSASPLLRSPSSLRRVPGQGRGHPSGHALRHLQGREDGSRAENHRGSGRGRLPLRRGDCLPRRGRPGA